MGILAEPAAMVAALRLPKAFSVCELGDQWLTHVSPHALAEPWYRSLGCGRYVSLDANGRGTMTVDLNQKLALKEQFDLVTDFGTGEHIFNQGQLWKSIHGLAKPGGYIAFDRPATGYPTHGFYLTDECLFRDLAAANRYEIVQLASGVTTRGSLWRGVFRVPNPKSGFLAPYQGRYRKSAQVAIP
jgi:hypothetical protein